MQEKDFYLFKLPVYYSGALELRGLHLWLQHCHCGFDWGSETDTLGDILSLLMGELKIS